MLMKKLTLAAAALAVSASAFADHYAPHYVVRPAFRHYYYQPYYYRPAPRLVASAFASRAAYAAPPANMKGIEELQKNWKSFVPAGAAVPSPGEPLKLSKDEWRKRLPADAFRVLREEGTERAGTSALNEEKRAGVFVCAGCGLPLFTSEMKYESGTGWPSFFTSIPGAFETKKDYFLIYP